MDFELCVMERDGAITGLRSAARHRVDLDDSSFRLVVGGRDFVGEAWNLGPLDRLAAQFHAAAERLSLGEDALVRSGVEDQPEVPWFLFAPVAEDVRVSCFVVPDRSLAGAFPIPRYSQRCGARSTPRGRCSPRDGRGVSSQGFRSGRDAG